MHQNYFGTDGEKQPFFLSVVLNDANNQGVPQYKAILWKKTVYRSSFYCRSLNIIMSHYFLKKHVSHYTAYNLSPWFVYVAPVLVSYSNEYDAVKTKETTQKKKLRSFVTFFDELSGHRSGLLKYLKKNGRALAFNHGQTICRRRNTFF